MVRRLAQYCEQRPLWPLLGLAFALRLPLLTWGLPLQSYQNWLHPDEHTVVTHALRFPSVAWDNPEPQYPSGLGILTRLTYPFSAPVRWLVHIPGADKSPYLPLLIWGRFVTLLLGCATVWVVYFAARRWNGEWGGCMAAAACAFSIWHVDHSCYLTGDVAASFGFGLSLLALYRFEEKPCLSRAVLAGLAIGLATAFKYAAGLGAVGMFALVSRGMLEKNCYEDAEEISCKHWLAFLALAAVCALGIFLLLNSSILFHPRRTFEFLRREARILQNQRGIPWLEYLAVLAARGWWLIGPAALLIPFGVKRAWLGGGWLLLVLPILFFLVFKGFLARHMIFLLPALFILIGCSVPVNGAPARKALAIILLSLNGLIAAFTSWQRAHDLRQSYAMSESIAFRSGVCDTLWLDNDYAYPIIPGKGRTIRGVGLAEMPDLVLMHSYTIRKLQRALKEMREPETGEIPRKYAWFFWKGDIPSQETLMMYEGLLKNPEQAGYEEVRRFIQPGSRLLRWRLEFFFHEFRMFVSLAKLGGGD